MYRNDEERARRWRLVKRQANGGIGIIRSAHRCAAWASRIVAANA
jgi:hypothetical protein